MVEEPRRPFLQENIHWQRSFCLDLADEANKIAPLSPWEIIFKQYVSGHITGVSSNFRDFAHVASSAILRPASLSLGNNERPPPPPFFGSVRTVDHATNLKGEIAGHVVRVRQPNFQTPSVII